MSLYTEDRRSGGNRICSSIDDSCGHCKKETVEIPVFPGDCPAIIGSVHIPLVYYYNDYYFVTPRIVPSRPELQFVAEP